MKTGKMLNSFRQRLLNNEVLIGCWCMLTNPISTEVLGLAGFDWLLLDGEHAPNNINTFITQLMALKASNSAAFVRPPTNDTVIIKQLLDIGFYNFLIPMVEDETQARCAVAATRYPPEGIRGVSIAHRSNRYGTIDNYFNEINENISVVVQIESKKAIDNIDAIAAISGVDGIFVGPGDLSAAMGHLGNTAHAEVQSAIRHIFARAKIQGKACGILAPLLTDARRYLENGATFVAVGSDLGILRKFSQELRNNFS